MILAQRWRRKTRATAALAALLCVAGCLRRDGRNSDCRWPAEATKRAADARHLSADAEFAEDLAIRYADTHHGLRTPGYVSGEAYMAARDQCLAALLTEAAKEHGVAPKQMGAALGRNRGLIDVAANLPFALLYCWAAILVTRMIWRRYPPSENGWMPGALMVLFLSLMFAGGSTLLGEVWSWFAENLRTGNDHLSYRVDRLPWSRYRGELFSGALAIFWAAGLDGARRLRPVTRGH